MDTRWLYLIKARALLLPTPLVDVDPGGEPERRDAIERILGLISGESGPDESFYDACHRDAYWAQTGAAAEPVVEECPALVNPLSAEKQHRPEDWTNQAKQHYAEWLKTLSPCPNANPGEWYRKLWSNLMALDPVGEGALGIPNSRRLPDHGVLSHRTLKAALAGARADAGDAAILMMHLGPVQGFIRAARRTHDSWMGSYLVGYLTWCAIRSIAEAVGPDAFVYPYLADTPLAREFLNGSIDGESEAYRKTLLHVAIPNRFLVVVPAIGAETLIQNAGEAAQKKWREFANEVKTKLPSDVGWDQGWDEQITHHLEIDAVTVPWPSDPKTLKSWLGQLGDQRARATVAQYDVAPYGPLYDSASRWLSSQRGESAPTMGEASTGADIRPKCGQCGHRAQMGPIAKNPRGQLAASRRFWTQLSQKIQEQQGGGADGTERLALDLTDGEGLCAVCLTKRFVARWCFGSRDKLAPEFPFDWDNKKPDDRPYLRFPSVESIATAPFRLCVAKMADDPAVKRWREALAELHQEDYLDYDPPGNLLPGLGKLGANPDDILSYDGSWSNEDAYAPERCFRDFFSRPTPDEAEAPEDFRILGRLRKQLPIAENAYRRVKKLVSDRYDVTPTPYYAILVMDVDAMGKWLRGDHPKQPTLSQLVGQLAGKIPPEGDSHRPSCPARHTELSRRVAFLAANVVPDIVHRHLGRAVYCGGDDLVAFLPIHTVFACADEVYQALQSAQYLGKTIQVSAGISIAHSRTPLGEALSAAHKAEGEAKKQGGGRMGISVRVRSGDPMSGVWPWVMGGGAGKTALRLPEVIDRLRIWSTREGDPVLDGPVIHRLAEEARILGNEKMQEASKPEEARILGNETMLEAFKHRIAVLTKRRAKERVDPPVGLDGELEFFAHWMDNEMGVAPNKDETAQRVCTEAVQFLMILRFLRREGGSLPASTFRAESETEEESA